MERNSHPHTSSNNIFTLVHNGIINNYSFLKNRLDGKYFKSETDTEVIVNLLEYNFERLDYKKVNKELIHFIIKKTLEELEGSWGLVIMCSKLPDHLFVVRKGSPLLVSLDASNIIVTSERSGFLNKVNNYISLENNDICIISEKDGIETNLQYSPITNILEKFELTPDPYKYWLQKEINDQRISSLSAINLGGRLLDEVVKLGGLECKKELLKNIDNIILLGCGTSYFAGSIGTNYLKTLCNFNTVQIFDGAEFKENDIPKKGNTAFILLSQSGETKDLHRCISIGRKANAILIGIINVVDSMIPRETDCGVYLNAGREVSVASTKSFTSQVIILAMVAIWFSQIQGVNNNLRLTYIKDLRRLHLNIDKCLQQDITHLIKLFQQSCFILGKENCEFIAKEGALKIKEVSYIHAEGYSTSSLKHGPFALLEPKFPVILCAPKNENYDKVMNAYEEIKARGAEIIMITDSETEFKNKIKIPNNNTFNDLLCIIPLQMLALELSISKNINPDIPRNLAKVVTVE